MAQARSAIQSFRRGDQTRHTHAGGAQGRQAAPKAALLRPAKVCTPTAADGWS